jgi:hypothetical protein
MGNLIAQEHATSEQEKYSDMPHHRFTVMMANAHIPGISESAGNKRRIVVPAWGLEYDYWFN